MFIEVGYLRWIRIDFALLIALHKCKNRWCFEILPFLGDLSIILPLLLSLLGMNRYVRSIYQSIYGQLYCPGCCLGGIAQGEMDAGGCLEGWRRRWARGYSRGDAVKLSSSTVCMHRKAISMYIYICIFTTYIFNHHIHIFSKYNITLIYIYIDVIYRLNIVCIYK